MIGGLNDPADLDEIVARVRRHRPTLVEHAHRQGRGAATALILHDQASRGPSVLFIERSVRETDRWSGQMALPGGRPHPSDRDLAATARREANEEVGIELPSPIGRLDDVGNSTSGLVVSPFVFRLVDEPVLELHPPEVQNAVWIPLAHLASHGAVTTTWHGSRGPFPAIRWDRYVIWGLTHRIITRFLGLIDSPTPPGR